jgi:hypothetical protein
MQKVVHALMSLGLKACGKRKAHKEGYPASNRVRGA